MPRRLTILVNVSTLSSLQTNTDFFADSADPDDHLWLVDLVRWHWQENVIKKNYQKWKQKQKLSFILKKNYSKSLPLYTMPYKTMPNC